MMARFWGAAPAQNQTDEVTNVPNDVAAAFRTAPEPIDTTDKSFADNAAMLELKVDLHQKLLDTLNLAALETASRESIRVEVGSLISEFLTEKKQFVPSAVRVRLTDEVLDELLGLGPLEPLLKDPSTTDILINTYKHIYVERNGRLEPARTQFKDERHLLRIINKIVSAVGRRVDESQPMVDARLADGSRVNAIIPPLAVDGALVSIRKFSRTPIDLRKLVALGSVPAEVAMVLEAVVRARRNVLISGGTGSGKTTLLNAMSAYIDGTERILTIEDSAELQLQQSHVGRLETRPANVEGSGEITQRELVKNALRMRPDRIILGECRSGEAFDMLQAMNTGHDGSMTTVHANTPRDALSRIEQMVGMAGLEIPARAVRGQIAAAVHVVVQVERQEDGRRRLVSLAEIIGMEEDIITTQEIFRFKREGRDEAGNVLGRFEATGARPKFLDVLSARGIDIPSHIFAPGRVAT
jgi:pilus assembly protein CpaF